MKTAIARVAALIAWCIAAHASAQTYQGHQLVRAELLANTTAIVPGKPFTVGLLLKMEPGWHTYWKFPGDAGLPTELKWQLPTDWRAGEIQWPIPLKLVEPGDVQIYGYRDEVLLTQEIVPAAGLDEKTIALNADASWLVCERICIPGDAKLQLSLPVKSDASPANEELFTRYRHALPQPIPGGAIAAASWQRSGAELLLRITSRALANYPAVDFFPLPEAKTVIGHIKSERTSDGVAFRIPIESPEQSLRKLDGVVVFGDTENSGSRNGWIISSETPPAGTSGGLAKFLLFGLIGGFILNLMPCVLPVISLKIFGFIKQAGQSRTRIFRSGVAFVAGIFGWFIALALTLIALKSAGREITWAFQFTSPTFVLAMSAIVLVFALNLFGLFEITLPQRASRRVVGFTEREGYAGSFFQGVFATILATPCTAPFLGTALGFAFTQSAIVILAMFIAIAAGMALPYLLLSAQPAWLRLLPKPGAWMVHVKQFMGFLLLATLLFLLWVLGAERGLAAVIWTCCFLLCISVACWIRGTFITPMATARARGIALVLMLALVVGSGWYFIGRKFANTRLTTSAKPAGDWQTFSPARVAEEQARGNAVFVDFTAEWCLSCKFNEATVLESDSVRDAFRRAGVVKLKADWTNADPQITKILKQFGRPGVPLYVLYPAGAAQEPIVFPELLTRTMLLDKLELLQPKVAAQQL